MIKKYLPGFFALILASFVITSCLNDDNLIPENCFDGELNNGEFDVDCGGPNCDPCPPSCTNGLWDVDFGEIDIDCGGPNCDPCPTCNDGILNQDETGIDCGGANCPGCPEPTCEDGILNGLETGIDCGDGLFCPECQLASQGQIIFRANNSDFEVYGGSTATTENLEPDPDNDPILLLTISGSQGSDEEITFIIPNSQNILPGQSLNFNAANGAAGYIIGLEYGVFGNYLTQTPNSGVTVTFDEISTALPGTPVVGTFSGVTYNFTESFSVTFTEGSFNLVVN